MCFHLQEYLTPGVVHKFRPYRSIFLLLIPYILSWVLILLGFCFARFAYLLHSGHKRCSSVIPLSSPIVWDDSRSVSPVP
uniref:Uncharacterized protein n=1 Tax=Caenorhabditis japonica TaxID=281687 RepID=A0A8R1IIW8_CAEJA